MTSDSDRGTSELQVTALVAEYQMLRQESLSSIGHRLSILSFTFAALAVLTAGLLQRRVDDVLAGAVAIAFVPQLAKAGLLVWLGEHARSQRAGRYLVGVEGRMNEVLGAPTMGWETSLAGRAEDAGGRGLHMRYPYVAVVVLLLGVGWAAEGLGVYLLAVGTAERTSDVTTALVAGSAALAAVVVEVVFLRFFAQRWRAAR